MVKAGCPWCFVEVFILMGLWGMCFVSVVNARVIGADLAKMYTTVKNRVDSIGVIEGDVGFLGSADSKGVARLTEESPKNWLDIPILTPGVFSKECAVLTKEKGWAEL